jgi:hypothetical protein
VRLDASQARPTLRVDVRLSERGAAEIADILVRRAHVGVVTEMRDLLGPAARSLIARRLAAVSRRMRGGPLTGARASAIADHVAEAIVATVAKQLPNAAATLAQAARAPETGATLGFTFAFADRDALMPGAPDAPTMTIRAGHDDG